MEIYKIATARLVVILYAYYVMYWETLGNNSKTLRFLELFKCLVDEFFSWNHNFRYGLLRKSDGKIIFCFNVLNSSLTLPHVSLNDNYFLQKKKKLISRCPAECKLPLFSGMIIHWNLNPNSKNLFAIQYNLLLLFLQLRKFWYYFIWRFLRIFSISYKIR